MVLLIVNRDDKFKLVNWIFDWNYGNWLQNQCRIGYFYKMKKKLFIIMKYVMKLYFNEICYKLCNL